MKSWKKQTFVDREPDSFSIALMILLRGFVIEIRIENVLQRIKRSVKISL